MDLTNNLSKEDILESLERTRLMFIEQDDIINHPVGSIENPMIVSKKQHELLKNKFPDTHYKIY